MKVLVINYDEVNCRKSSNEVIGDIISFYKEASSDTIAKLGSEFMKNLEQIALCGAEIEWADTFEKTKRQLLLGLIKKRPPDILVSYNYAGFEWATLTDGLGYNLIPCKQIHVVDKGYTNENVARNKIRGINLFIYCK